MSYGKTIGALPLLRIVLMPIEELASELIYAGVLAADEFRDMECNDPEWFVNLYVRKTAFAWAFRNWIGIKLR